MNAFHLQDVWFSYGSGPVLSGVSLAVRPGETVALLGRNGAGKTTLTRLLVALLHPDSGTVSIGGDTTAGKAPEDLADTVAYVFQHPDQQLFQRTVLDEVAFGPRQGGVGRSDAERAAVGALERLGLAELRATHPYDLPLPHRRLITIAAAVAQDPRLLVLDEPTQGLDREASTRVSALVRDLASSGVAVLAVTHDLAFVAEALDRVVVLVRGVIGADEGAHSVLMSPTRSSELGLRQPEPARLSHALALPGTPLRATDVAAALRDMHRSGSLRDTAAPVREARADA